MTSRRLIELWEPPRGYRLASAIATTYELQADFLEEDLLPVALSLRLTTASGRAFRIELERALQDTEVSVFFHPARYQRGLRGSLRVDLVALHESRFPKLHAKLALLRFAPPSAPELDRHVVRLIISSANLTNQGYRNNIEVAAAIDDAPGGTPVAATVVRDGAAWLEQLVGEPTEQVARQFRDLNAVFARRPVTRQEAPLRFIGLPSAGGFPSLFATGGRVKRLTIASPFWPTGDDPSDVAAALRRLCGGHLNAVRLVGPADVDEDGTARPVIPAGFVRALLSAGARVEVAAADPTFGCDDETDDEDEGEFDEVAERAGFAAPGRRSLHAKALLAEGDESTSLAIGSFNLTRKGLGLARNGNVEAGLMWTLPKRQAAGLEEVLAFGMKWQTVTRTPEEFLVEPPPMDPPDANRWPAFLLAVRATRESLIVEGDGSIWPEAVVVRMKDVVQSQRVGREVEFDLWTILKPSTEGDFTVATSLQALCGSRPSMDELDMLVILPDLEAEIAWNGNTAVVPVLFEDKHRFPVVTFAKSEDERSLIDWFLGLRPEHEAEAAGFGHGIDPIPGGEPPLAPTNDILSYLVRDFVHALPGVRQRLAEAGVTETGLRTALLGARSPVELARQAMHAYRNPLPGRPKKTALATAFQLTELKNLLRTVVLPDLADGASESLRAEAVAEVTSALREAVAALGPHERSEVIDTYLGQAEDAP